VPEATILYILHGVQSKEVVIRPQPGVVATFHVLPDNELAFTISFADGDNTRLLFSYRYAVLPNCMVSAEVRTTALRKVRRT
jgi:hypothetical protein